jgi:hypothetical protein
MIFKPELENCNEGYNTRGDHTPERLCLFIQKGAHKLKVFTHSCSVYAQFFE